MSRVMPKFQAEKQPPGLVITETFYTREPLLDADGDPVVDEKTNRARKYLKAHTRDVTLDNAYMVYFPHGHSVLYRDEKALRGAGFVGEAVEIDMETGLPVIPPEVADLKAINAQKTKTRASMRG